MNVAQRPHYSIAEYVKVEEYSNVKHEYFDGQLWAMAGGTPEHARLASGVISAFVSQLRGRRCAVFSSDARVRVRATGLDTYPDVSVVCDREQRDPEDALALVNPIVLVEITSDSTEAYDRGEKFDHYKRLDSLREFVVLSHREPLIEVFARRDNGVWAKTAIARPGGHAPLASIGCELVVDDIYRDPLRSDTLDQPGS